MTPCAPLASLLAVQGSSLPAAPSVTLAWNSSPDPTLVGYQLYYGTSSRNYSNIVPVGTGASATVSGLTPGVTYYFSVTSVNELGMESGYSDEISYTVPTTRPRLQLLPLPSKQVLLRITGQRGNAYEIQATQNFTNWNVIGIVTLDFGVSVDFIDVNAAGRPSRFYRAREIPRPRLQLFISPAKQVILRVTGQPGHVYEVQATQDFSKWSVLGAVGLGLSDSLDLLDPTAAGQPARFYRLREIQ